MTVVIVWKTSHLRSAANGGGGAVVAANCAPMRGWCEGEQRYSIAAIANNYDLCKNRYVGPPHFMNMKFGLD
jgi:hypothetical protein